MEINAIIKKTYKLYCMSFYVSCDWIVTVQHLHQNKTIKYNNSMDIQIGDLILTLPSFLAACYTLSIYKGVTILKVFKLKSEYSI